MQFKGLIYVHKGGGGSHRFSVLKQDQAVVVVVSFNELRQTKRYKMYQYKCSLINLLVTQTTDVLRDLV